MLTNCDVSLTDNNSGVMDRLSETLLLDNSLESSFQELVESKSENVIEFLLTFLEETKLNDSSNEGITFEKSSGISFIEGEELSGSLSQSSKSELDSPDFSLTSKTIFTDGMKLGHKSFLIEGFSRGLRSFLVVSVSLWHSSNNNEGLIDPDSYGDRCAE